MSEEFRQELDALRRRFDEADERLVQLLNERAELSLEMGSLKRGSDAAIFMPAREAEVFDNLRRLNRGPLRDEHLRAIYREIISSSRDLQRRPRVAYLGPPGTFSHQAALAVFGSATEYLPRVNFTDVFADVHAGNVDCGVVPIENSTEGIVQQNLDLLAESESRICGEVTIPVAHHLMARCLIGEVRTVYSHPQTEGQCRRWLAENLPGREVVMVTSNTKSAELAAAEDGTAAISPRLAAEIYGLNILAENIQDLGSNYTRFFVISTQPTPRPTGRDKTAICFSIRDHVGALRDVVQIFAEARLNLSSIQSRPSKRRAWEYIFFLEIDAHEADEKLAVALREMEQHCVFLKVLGAWPVPARG